MMGSTSDMLSFWTSLVSAEEMSSHLLKLMEVDDEEDRALLMVSRILFMFTMGVKKERNSSEKENKRLNRLINKLFELKEKMCYHCSMLLNNCDLFIKNKENSPNSPSNINTINTEQVKKEIIDSLMISPIKSPRILSPLNKDSLKRPITHVQQNNKKAKFQTSSISKESTSKFKLLASNCTSPQKPNILAPETQKVIFLKHKDSKGPTIVPETAVIEGASDDNLDFFDIPCTQLSPMLRQSDVFNTSNTIPCLTVPTSPVVGKRRNKDGPKNDDSMTSEFESSPDKCTIKEKKSHSKYKSEDLEGSPIMLSSDLSPLSPTKMVSLKKVTKKILLNEDAGESSSASYNKGASRVSDKKFLSTRNLPSKVSTNNTNLKKQKIINKLASNSSNKNYEVTFESPNDKPVKKLKQIKITAQLKPKNKLIPPKKENEEDLLKKALDESLKTKQYEDMMRKQEESDLQMYRSDGATNGEKKNLKTLSRNCLKKGARTNTSDNCQSTSSKTTKIISESAAMDFLDKDSQEFDNPATPSPPKKPVQIKKTVRKVPILDESFDLPAKEIINKGRTAKQWERKQLEGWDCRECQQYYDGRNLTEEEKKSIQNRCSRHRSTYNPVSNTPKGYWNPDFSDIMD